jgi:hypothetical protein
MIVVVVVVVVAVAVAVVVVVVVVLAKAVVFYQFATLCFITLHYISVSAQHQVLGIPNV